ncbi:MAG: riboflavin synthase [Candidatus Humimicrobiaceae bacterium]
MFTGIIKKTGRVSKIATVAAGKKITIECSEIFENLKIGDSIAVDGCCLTVKSKDGDSFSADLSRQTIENTTFKNIREGQIVNLEEALAAGEKLGGHFVSGHIDNVARILDIKRTGDFYNLEIELKEGNKPFVVSRGSIALDGISLTIAAVSSKSFSLTIIPHTFNNTNLYAKKAGILVNLEVDLLARYMANYLENRNISNKDKLLKEKLEKYGFI